MKPALAHGYGSSVSIPAKSEATIVLALLTFRWVAGILENLGVPALSEIAATFMLCGLATLLLQRMRLATETALFVTGILAWVGSGALSFAANSGGDARATISLLTLLILYGLFANSVFTYFRTQYSLRHISRFLIAFIVTGFGLSLMQVFAGAGFIEPGKEHIQRAFGSDVHPVSFAVQILAAMVTLEIIRLKQARRANLPHFMLLFLGSVALYLSYARTAWVMAVIILAISVVLRGSLSRRIVTAAITGTLGVFVLLSSERFTDLGSLPFFLENFSFQDVVFDWRYIDNSVSWRIVNWSYGVQQALEQPGLGFGPGQSAISSYFNLEMHNIFLEVFFEGGLIGLCALIVTVCGLIRIHLMLPDKTNADQMAQILANGFGIALLLAVTFSTSFVDQLMSFFLYMLMLVSAFIPSTLIQKHSRNC